MANRYWVGSGIWDTSTTTNWSTSSGGSGGAAVPTSSDNVFVDANSGSMTTASLVTLNCLNIDFTGYTNTFSVTGSATLNIFGNCTLGVGMTFSGTTTSFTFSSTSSSTITSNGKTFTAPLTFNGIGGTWTLQDNFTLGTGSSMTLTKGTFNANNYNVTIPNFSSSNSNTRTVTMGSGLWTLNGTGTVWNMANATNLTLNSNLSTIKITDSSNTTTSFSGGGQTFNNIYYSRGASTASNTIVGSNTFSDFKDDGSVAHSILFTSGITTTVTTFTVSGGISNLISINSTTTAIHTLTKSGGGTISCDYLNIQHSVATPSSTWYAGANSTNNQAVSTAGSGWIFTVPPTPSTANAGFLLNFI